MNSKNTEFAPPFKNAWQFENQKDIEKVSVELDALYAKKQLSDEELDALFRLGRELATALERTSGDVEQNLRRLTSTFLNLGRANSVLTKVYERDRKNEWFEILLALIVKANYTLSQLFRDRLNEYGKKPLFKEIRSGKVIEYAWQNVHEKINSIARSLLSFSTNSSGTVGILSDNSLDMACIDLACLSCGIVNVPIPTNTVPQNIAYILNQAKIEAVFVEDEIQLKKILEIRSQVDHLQKIIIMQSTPTQMNDDRIIPYKNFLKQGEKVTQQMVEQARRQVKIHDLATIMYTSGTTEAPKGIMFSHLNIVSKRFARAIALPEIGDQDTFLCYLPLFHTFGRYFEMMGCIFWGSTYVFLENVKIETVIASMQLVHPTVFISIPKKWIQLYEKIREEIDIETAPRENIKQTVSKMTGGKLKWGLSAAGYLDPDIFKFFQTYGIELMSGFGMTEATGGITMTPPFQYRFNSVGQALPGIDIRLDDDGEMLIRGPYVMVGFFGDVENSKEEGWLHTGDIFSKDEHGFYQIIDRKKEIYKNVKGETIAPQKVENLFQDFESVKRVFLVGDHREFNTLLLYPNYDYDQVDLKKMSKDELKEFFSSLIVSVNRFLGPFERIVNFSIIDRDFDAEKGELTPKSTYKRKVIAKNFRDVIENMYAKDYAVLHAAGLEVRVPNWFLREKGLTSEDLTVIDSKISIRPAQAKLTLRLVSKDNATVQFGTCTYFLRQNYLDLQDFISNPGLWIGNLELQAFVGDEIYRWSSLKEFDSEEIAYVFPQNMQKPDRNVEEEFAHIKTEEQTTLRGIHLAAFLIQTSDERVATEGITYLEGIIETKDEQFSNLAQAVLMRTADCGVSNIRKNAFQVLLLNEQRDVLKPILEKYLVPKNRILDNEIIAKISRHDFSDAQLESIFDFLHDLSDSEKWETKPTPHETVISLLSFFSSYGINHPTGYKMVRKELTQWSLFKLDTSIAKHARDCLQELLTGFRDWLSSNQLIAVDFESSQEYRWDDVICFDEDVDAEDKEKISKTIKKIPIIREAIFLFTGGTLVRLQDIPYRGIWVSFLGALHGKAVYRISVQTRHYGAFDIAVNVNKTLSQDEVKDEINWLICAGATEGHQLLVEDFGGYWPEYDLWTEEFIPGETIEKFLRRIERQAEKEEIERIQILWSYLVWSGLSAYVDFWERTGRVMEIADPTPANVIVPSHDYQVGFRIVSISKRKPFENIAKMILAFRHNFVLPVENKYDELRGQCSWQVIFSAFVEVLGEKAGLEILERCLNSIVENAKEELLTLKENLTEFIQAIHKKGFKPKRLYYAIRRFKRWHTLNPAATQQAIMQTLQELYTTYNLENLEKIYPATRIQFFRDAVFAQSDKKLIEVLNHLIQNRESLADNNLLVEEISKLKTQIDLSDTESFFLTRLTYPHLGPKDSAELISLESPGMAKTALLVFIKDTDGNRYGIRYAATPKEIARLHRLFVKANLPVEFRPEHQYLVILSDRGRVVGGMFYRYAEPKHVHLEKIVVDERFRRKGVSDGLMHEFFERLRSEGIEMVTVGFLRPEYFYKFGFTIDQRYGNMVKKLKPESKKEIADELVGDI